jgi:hypothetical protein
MIRNRPTFMHGNLINQYSIMNTLHVSDSYVTGRHFSGVQVLMVESFLNYVFERFGIEMLQHISDTVLAFDITD